MVDSNEEFVFSRHDDIGAAGAEDDAVYLNECFVDNGDIDVVMDCKSPKRLLIGRTGSGKSALLNEVANRSRNVIQLSPHTLSLNYIANNNVIAFFEALGVNLSVFYGLLWKHIFVVELLKKKFDIRNEDAQKNYTRHIKSILYKKDKIKEQAVDYLENWGNKFWLTTEERMKELTEKLEENLGGELKGRLPGVEVSASGAASLTSEQKKEIVEHGKRAVSEVQVRELENIINVLADDIFDDPQQQFYITIDMLDEEWVDDRIKLRLIKSLIDTIRRFRKVHNVKVVAALRQDLLDRVVHSAREPGFQEEKYESLYLYIGWNKNSLRSLVEKRVNFLVKRKYTNGDVKFLDVFPENVGQEKAFDYLVDRTFMRPRDMILFVNESIVAADGESKITSSIVKKAEEPYSYKRLQSLATEWLGVFPNLYCVMRMFDGMRSSFRVSDITREFIDEKYTEAIDSIADITIDPITTQIDRLYSNTANFNSVRNSLIRGLYLVGMFGVKTGPSSTVNWAHLSRMSMSPGEVKPSSIINIHPMFYRALNVRL